MLPLVPRPDPQREERERQERHQKNRRPGRSGQGPGQANRTGGPAPLHQVTRKGLYPGRACTPHTKTPRAGTPGRLLGQWHANAYQSTPKSPQDTRHTTTADTKDRKNHQASRQATTGGGENQSIASRPDETRAPGPRAGSHSTLSSSSPAVSQQQKQTGRQASNDGTTRQHKAKDGFYCICSTVSWHLCFMLMSSLPRRERLSTRGNTLFGLGISWDAASL